MTGGVVLAVIVAVATLDDVVGCCVWVQVSARIFRATTAFELAQKRRGEATVDFIRRIHRTLGDYAGRVRRTPRAAQRLAQ